MRCRKTKTDKKHSEGWFHFQDFINLPSKTVWKEYYLEIKEPMSLQKLWRAVRGMHGRGGATGISHFKSWAAMEQKAALLWTNARKFNAEGSEIYGLANELEVSYYLPVSLANC